MLHYLVIIQDKLHYERIKMQILYSPWRSSDQQKKDKRVNGCVLCYIAQANEEELDELGVLYRTKELFIVMNKYPYSPGHFMVVPNIHTKNLEGLDTKVWQDMNIYIQSGVKLLKDSLNAQGVNLGMNLGEVGGGSIAEHIHYHLVPRWKGDTNFITTINDTKIYGVDFDKIYKKLKENVSKYFK